MTRILSILFLVGVLAGCQPDNPIPSYWNADYAQYMQEFGYTYDEIESVILKNDIPIWELPQSCLRFCATSYVGPNGLHRDLLENYNGSLELSIEMYRQENLQILGLGD